MISDLTPAEQRRRQTALSMAGIETTCNPERYEYGSEIVDVVLFDATMDIKSRSFSMELGASTGVQGEFSKRDTETVGNGIFGMAPRRAFELMQLPAMGMDDLSQFLFDAVKGEIRFGSFHVEEDNWFDVEAAEWDVDKARYGLWLVPGTRMGDIVLDTGTLYMLLAPSFVEDYFNKVDSRYLATDAVGNRYIDCNTPPSQLPNLNIDLAPTDSEGEYDETFPIPGARLIGRQTQYKEPGRTLCYSLLQKQRGKYPMLG